MKINKMRKEWEQIGMSKICGLWDTNITREIFGTPGAIRTHDTRIRNPLLYPTELRGHADLKIEFLTLFQKRVNDIGRFIPLKNSMSSSGFL